MGRYGGKRAGIPSPPASQSTLKAAFFIIKCSRQETFDTHTTYSIKGAPHVVPFARLGDCQKMWEKRNEIPQYVYGQSSKTFVCLLMGCKLKLNLAGLSAKIAFF